jgi:hypothetical protein
LKADLFLEVSLTSPINIQCIFLIGMVGGGVQLSLLGNAATNRPILTSLGDYDAGEIDEMMIGRGNRNTWRKPVAAPLCPPQTPHAKYMFTGYFIEGW